jgi:phospholipid/cholesterol/gamma-HCH transport system substrate-binding protein
MQSRASHALVALFTLAVVAALFGFAYWFSSGGSTTVNIRINFNDRVSGLGRGSSVLFNGLRVGEVTEIAIEPGNPRQIYAVAKVDRSTPLRADTSAGLEGQGLAGVVALQLRGGDPGSPALVAQPGQSLPTITAEPFADIFEKVRTIAKSADEAIGGIETAIKDNAGSIGDTIKNMERFSGTLSENSGSVDKLMGNIGAVADFISPIPGKVDAFSEQVTQAIRSVDRGNIISVIDRTATFSATLGAATPDVSKTVKDVASISEKLNRAADQVEGVLKGAQTFLNAGAGQDGHNTFDDIAEVAKSMRVLADNLDKRSAAIASEIIRFAGLGLRTIESVTSTGRRSLTGVDRTLRQVQRNPQQLIFGSGPTLPQYNGQR